MSEKIKKYNDIAIEVAKFAPILVKDDHDAELETVKLIRELRQIIERLRRVVGESDTDEPPRSLTDMNKLHKDELAFVAWQFWEWYNENECPIDKCHDYFCRHCQLRKDEADEELADGSLSQEEYNIMAKDKFHDDMCDDMQTGCWVQYYLWCYRNGYDPQTGKKNK